MDADNAQWKDLAGDQGASTYVRLIVEALMKTNPTYSSPNNYGDPLLQYQFGMKYGAEPDFVYDILALPQVTETVVTESNGSTRTSYESFTKVRAGEPFTVDCLLWNNGADGVTTVQVKANDEVVAEKIMAVTGGSWRVFETEITLEAGEYTISVGDLTGTLTVVE